MKKRTLRAVAAIISMLLLLAGCEQGASEPVPTTTLQTTVTEETDAVLIPTTGPINPTTEPTEATEPTEPPPSLEPVTLLSSIRWKTYPELLSLGNGNLLACRNYYEEGSGIVNFLDIFNVYDDRVLVQGRNETPRELVEQQFTDGCFVISDPATNTFYVYDQQLHVSSSFTAPNTEGWFSHDRSSYYFVENRMLYRMDVASGNYGRMALQEDLRLESLLSIHPDRDILCAKVYLSYYQDYCGIGVIDCTTGNLLFLKDDIEYLWFDEDRFYAAKTNDRMYGNDLYSGSLDGGLVEYITAEALGSDTVSYNVLSDSGYMVLHTVDEDNLSTTIYDLFRKGASSELKQYGYSTSTLDPIYMEQEQLIFGLWPDGYYFSPVVIDPKVLQFQMATHVQSTEWKNLVDERLLINYRLEMEGADLSTQLQSQRQKADELEEKYGVRILIGRQTNALCGTYTEAEETTERIDMALIQLDEALSLYPEGFFAQLRNGAKEGGIYLCLTGRITGDLSPVGMTKRNGDRYDLAIDITSDGLARTVHHEIWHAIEMKMSTDSFDHPQWEACNPTDFQYYGSYDSGYGTLTDHTFEQSGPGCYFVDAYSKINGTEDRARLMENVMATDATALLQSTALREKLQIMSKAIRDHFDTDGWQTPYWERYL